MVGFACIRGPTDRGVPMQSPRGWLEAKRIDDKTDGLWRVDNALYDLPILIILIILVVLSS